MNKIVKLEYITIKEAEKLKASDCSICEDVIKEAKKLKKKMVFYDIKDFHIKGIPY